MTRRNIVILGSTGSIGINALKVIERFPTRFNVVGLTAYNNYRLLEEQIRKFNPARVAVNGQGVEHLRRHINTRRTKVLNVTTGTDEIIQAGSVDVIVVAMHGSAALRPFLTAVRAGKTVAPANKEALVSAGDILMREAQRHKATIVPIDSEQSAIFQCLAGEERRYLKKIYLTASGGTLLNVAPKRFDNLSIPQILKHPRWKMGKRITVDSASLMNKGFEVIEAKHLFGVAIEDITVIVHPEAIIHSMVEFKDGSIMAQLGITDMRLPIQYALTYPQRWDTGLKSVDFIKLRQLTFREPDFKKFPSLSLAIDAGKRGGTLPAVLNAADEIAVDAFLNHRLKFTGIYSVVEKIVQKHKVVAHPSFSQILDADQWARQEADQLIGNDRKPWKRS